MDILNNPIGGAWTLEITSVSKIKSGLELLTIVNSSSNLFNSWSQLYIKHAVGVCKV